MTSLMDLSFLLLITFIISYPTLEQGINVKLPRGTADAIEHLKSQTLAIDAQGGIFLNNRRIGLDALEGELAVIVAKEPQTAVLVRGDERLDYGQVVKVLRVLHKARVTRMALVTEPE